MLYLYIEHLGMYVTFNEKVMMQKDFYIATCQTIWWHLQIYSSHFAIIKENLREDGHYAHPCQTSQGV